MKTKGAKKMKSNKTTKAAYVRTQSGGLFGLGNKPVGLEAIEAALPDVQTAINALPNGKQKTTIAHGFANFYGYVKSCDWLRGVSGISPVES